jgi:adenylate kinase
MSELNLVLLGPPGSGKGTQGERLQEDFHLPYSATGDILRAAVRDGSDLGKQVKGYMDRGDFAPDELMVEVIAERLEAREAADGFILDGFPRTMHQAEALDAKLGELGRRLSAAVLIDVSDDEVVRRLGGRRGCSNGHVFHVEFDPPKNEGTCDVCGAPLEVRDDDKPDVIRHRLAEYHAKTEAPLVPYYEGRGILKRVDGDRPPDEVSDRIRALLATLRMEEEL